MSGGSWDYVCFKIEDAADRLGEDRSAMRRGLGQHMKLIAHAMHEIEWVDSNDKSWPSDRDAIKAVFEDFKEKPELEILIKDAKELIEQLSDCVEGKETKP